MDILQNNFFEFDSFLKEYLDLIWIMLLGFYVYNMDIFEFFFVDLYVVIFLYVCV